MPNTTELDARLTIVELKIAGAVELPVGSVDVNDTTVIDKTGFSVFGRIAGINSGKLFVGISLVANPTLDAHIDTPFTFKEF